MMKNSASELYCASGYDRVAYQHAFGYIRQLAVLLRAGMKSKTKVGLLSHDSYVTSCLTLPLKEAYKQVYNWQYVHSIDFWCLVLARACSEEAAQAAGRESELRSLIYPLVQVSIGTIQSVSLYGSYMKPKCTFC